jgi:hypothetical protein
MGQGRQEHQRLALSTCEKALKRKSTVSFVTLERLGQLRKECASRFDHKRISSWTKTRNVKNKLTPCPHRPTIGETRDINMAGWAISAYTFTLTSRTSGSSANHERRTFPARLVGLKTDRFVPDLLLHISRLWQGLLESL